MQKFVFLFWMFVTKGIIFIASFLSFIIKLVQIFTTSYCATCPTLWLDFRHNCVTMPIFDFYYKYLQQWIDNKRKPKRGATKKRSSKPSNLYTAFMAGPFTEQGNNIPLLLIKDLKGRAWWFAVILGKLYNHHSQAFL